MELALNEPSKPIVILAEPRPAGSRRWPHFVPPFIAILAVLGYGFFLQSFWAPAPDRPGVDENAYLLGGVNIADHGNAGFKPANPYEFVGAMWFRNSGKVVSPPTWIPNPLRRWMSAHPKAGWYYPKYPLGLPALNAIVIKLGNRDWPLAIPPVAMTLAAAGTFLLAREIVPGFFALLAMLAIMFGPTSLQLAEQPNSHAIDLCAVVWGMWLLLRWWRGSHWITGLFAGLLLGIAVTFRYSEAMLLFPLYPLDQVLSDTSIKVNHGLLWDVIEAARFLPVGPLGIAVLWRFCSRKGRSRAALPPVLRSVLPGNSQTENDLVVPDDRVDTSVSVERDEVRTQEPAAEPLGSVPLHTRIVHHSAHLLPIILPLLAWALPVATMLICSWYTTGHLTGYDATHESAGFSTADFLQKWDFTIFQLLVYGLFLILPIGLAGLVMIFADDRRVAWMLSLWFVPGMLLYTAYYWGDNTPGVGYLRFFLSVFPAIIIAATWLLWRASQRAPGDGRWSIAGPIGAGFIIVSAAAIGLYISLPELVRQHRGNLNLAYSTREILHFVHGSSNPKNQPVVFVDDGIFPQLLMHMQPMTDAEWFASDGFEPRVGGGFGIFGMFEKADAKHNAPVLLQRARIDYMNKLNDGKTDADFVKMERTVIDTALATGRPVFAVLTEPQARLFKMRVKDSSMKMVKKTQWTEPCGYHPPSPGPNPRNPNAPRGIGPLAPPNWSGEPIVRWYPQTLVLYQLTRPG